MQIDEIMPQPQASVPFAESSVSLLTDRPGCFILTDESLKILYIGRSKNLQNSLRYNLTRPEIVKKSLAERPDWFFYFEHADADTLWFEWANFHYSREGMEPYWRDAIDVTDSIVS